MPSKEPYVPTGIQISEITDDSGATLGVLIFHTEEGEISFYIDEHATGVLETAVEKLKLFLSKRGKVPLPAETRRGAQWFSLAIRAAVKLSFQREGT